MEDTAFKNSSCYVNMTEDTTTNSTTLSTNPTPHNSLASSNKNYPDQKDPSTNSATRSTNPTPHNLLAPTNKNYPAQKDPATNSATISTNPTPHNSLASTNKNYPAHKDPVHSLDSEERPYTGNFYFSNDQNLRRLVPKTAWSSYCIPSTLLLHFSSFGDLATLQGGLSRGGATKAIVRDSYIDKFQMVDPAERVTRASESFLSCFLQWPVMSAGQTKTWEDFGNSNLTSHICSTAILAIAGAGNQIQQPKGSWNTLKKPVVEFRQLPRFPPQVLLFH